MDISEINHSSGDGSWLNMMLELFKLKIKLR